MKEQMTFKPNDRIQIVTLSTILRHRHKTKEIDCILKYMFQYCGQQGTILSIHGMQYPMHATALEVTKEFIDVAIKSIKCEYDTEVGIDD